MPGQSVDVNEQTGIRGHIILNEQTTPIVTNKIRTNFILKKLNCVVKYYTLYTK